MIPISVSKLNVVSLNYSISVKFINTLQAKLNSCFKIYLVRKLSLRFLKDALAMFRIIQLNKGSLCFAT